MPRVLVLVLVLAVAAVAVWAAAFHSEAAQDVDAWLLRAIGSLDNGPLEYFADVVVLAIQPVVYGTLCVAVVALSLWRRGPALAAATALILAGANLTTQALKPALAEPRFHAMLDEQIAAESWPSGHATASAALGLALVLVYPRLRIPAAVFALTIGVAVVLDFWHYPSDVLGGYLVAGAWAAAAAALVRKRLPAPTAAPRRRWLRATG